MNSIHRELSLLFLALALAGTAGAESAPTPATSDAPPSALAIGQAAPMREQRMKGVDGRGASHARCPTGSEAFRSCRT